MSERYTKAGETIRDNYTEKLKETIKELELENAKHIGDGEWDIRDITYRHGKFRLEEWGERYHQFYDDDKALEDEEVVSLLFENEQLKQDIEYLEKKIKENEWHWNTIDEDRDVWHYKCTEAEKRVKELKTENEQLKKENKELQGKASSWKITASEEMMKQGDLVKENAQLKKEVLELRAEIGRLNHKKEIEQPHWSKYENNKGYTKKVNQDIRFGGGDG